MNIEKAMIIKTNSNEQTVLAQKLREVIKATGNEVVLIPQGVTDLFITANYDGNLEVYLQNSNNGFNCTDLDVATGFDSVGECWDYAKLVIKEAGLPEDSCDADIWEVETDPIAI